MAAHVNERSCETAAGTKLCRACVDFKTWVNQQKATFKEVMVSPYDYYIHSFIYLHSIDPYMVGKNPVYCRQANWFKVIRYHWYIYINGGLQFVQDHLLRNYLKTSPLSCVVTRKQHPVLISEGVA
jgi:hypothetical protein